MTCAVVTFFGRTFDGGARRQRRAGPGTAAKWVVTARHQQQSGPATVTRPR
ncbi:hypothetical protein [Paenarthrobacter nitroguajacolicus]|uniref:hypothetical protein n=1 Tax=Paenarthrobacter nitroguajacolicus TaxID=211146 RepID=UPI002866E716|nr:hypothetical protein [Paenarthrobacter nitroguajacolicus]MDR6640059.1 hypothetical protein [Paenarthrobacter nitroguajacolicus]